MVYITGSLDLALYPMLRCIGFSPLYNVYGVHPSASAFPELFEINDSIEVRKPILFKDPDATSVGRKRDRQDVLHAHVRDCPVHYRLDNCRHNALSVVRWREVV